MAVRKTWVLRFQWKILHYLVNLLTVRIGEKKRKKKKGKKRLFSRFLLQIYASIRTQGTILSKIKIY